MLVITASVTLLQDFGEPSPNSAPCRFGFCRSDQVNSELSYTAMDPANPYKWAAYAESLDNSGDVRAAEKAFDRALALGPAIAPVQMRALNFHLIHEHTAEVLALGKRILQLTPAYNELIFSDYFGVDMGEILRKGIPPQTLPAYLTWAEGTLPTADLVKIWAWMSERKLTDENSASGLTTALCRRREYSTAAHLWAAWLPLERRAGYLQSNFLSNPNFAVPFKTPLDWTLDSPGGLETIHKDGLTVTFPGTANLAYNNVRQLSYVIPGAYLFTAVVEGLGITTNEGPFFHLFDADHPGGFGISTEQIHGTTQRRTIEVRFVVRPETRALVTQLERKISEKLDNKIAGTLKIHEVTLRKID
ncbi:MAG: hypothetical protein J0H49_21510 [Acidobacteria bacterium]|nr:hypothetical protein [Acidobacteriota bacterium]